MSKAILVTEMPKKCSKCPYCDGDGWCYLQEQYIDVEENKERDSCCPLKPYSEFIPIKWIEEYTTSLAIKRRFLAENGYRDNRCYDYLLGIMGMLEDWEKENEQAN